MEQKTKQTINNKTQNSTIPLIISRENMQMNERNNISPDTHTFPASGIWPNGRAWLIRIYVNRTEMVVNRNMPIVKINVCSQLLAGVTQSVFLIK